MKISRPSPAMVVASLALFVALGGTGIAAVNYARNAGKVDGRDAVKASKSRSQAAGNLVATKGSGPEAGQIPAKFLAGVPRSSSFARNLEVQDNLDGAPETLLTSEGLGSLTMTCGDQARQAGLEDPTSTIAFNSTSGVNTSKRIGGGNGQVAAQPAGTAQSVTINGSNTFEFQVQAPDGRNLLIQGVVRQDGRGTPAATCLGYGTSLVVRP
jgi:hypothetical protein